MSDHTTPPDAPYEGAPLRGRKKFVIILVTVVAAALVAIGAVVAIVNDLGSRELADPGAGVTVSPTPTGSPGATPTPTPTEAAGEEQEPGDDGEPTADAGEEPPWEAPPVEEPVDLDDAATSSAGVVADVDTIEAVTGEAQGPGEVGGPALRIMISLANNSGETVNLESTVVALYHGPDQTPGVELSGPGVDRFGGMLPPGGTAQGIYVFTCPPDERDRILVTVSTTPFDSTVAFEGAAA